jgi:hypothetical protein
MDDDTPKEEREATVLVFRNGAGDPIAVPTDVVTEAERAFRAHQLRVGGMTWAQVAEAEKYSSASACKYDVDRYMAEARSLVVESSAREMLTLEVTRLDALQHALWPAAMSGHVPSAALAMNIIVNRAKLVGLDPEKMMEEADKARTVVVPVDEDGYTAALQRAAGDTPAPS